MDSIDRDSLANQVRAMQIIVLALAMGIFTFGVVVIGLGLTDQQPEVAINPPTLEEPLEQPAGENGEAVDGELAAPGNELPADEQEQWGPFIAYLAIGFAMIATVLGFIVPQVIAARSPATIGTYQSTLIVGCALFEGAAFFNLIAYMLEGQLYSLVIAALLMLCILSRFPTVAKVEEWLEARLRSERDEAMFAR
ncbi:hypothetical protein [Aeoliella mucimassa]|uniref:Uncharacterized protein n=1 Tax=Aeoliella mucimassa TaxID=2527972 RepID=A0A518AUM5_9BACT|nr:hypothetical protein [Aeoliella mucimassa]QDU58415.1 hypothetical protein Pan181_46500 [Aeoliella mucimassa]